MSTILFADDADMVRKMYTGVLRKKGYSVLEAVDGAEALSVARRYAQKIDLLITDLLMPRMGGLELREALRAMHPETRVLFISGYAGATPESSAPFLQKPFTPSTLLSRVTEILPAEQ
jgi:CheY-like chemotaxis protein